MFWAKKKKINQQIRIYQVITYQRIFCFLEIRGTGEDFGKRGVEGNFEKPLATATVPALLKDLCEDLGNDRVCNKISFFGSFSSSSTAKSFSYPSPYTTNLYQGPIIQMDRDNHTPWTTNPKPVSGLGILEKSPRKSEEIVQHKHNRMKKIDSRRLAVGLLCPVLSIFFGNWWANREEKSVYIIIMDCLEMFSQKKLRFG